MPVIYRRAPQFKGHVIDGTPPDRNTEVPLGNQSFRQLPVPAITREGATRLHSRSVPATPVKATFYAGGINPWNKDNHSHDGVLDGRDPQALYRAGENS
jgi:hypothetical protein